MLFHHLVSDTLTQPEKAAMRVKLTDTSVRSSQPRPKGYSIGDSSCPGLCLRITPAGIKSFAFAGRSKVTGKVHWITLGRYPDLPLTRAREAANDIRKVMANGGTILWNPRAGVGTAEKKLRPTPKSSISIALSA
jgi:hypothetical protein